MIDSFSSGSKTKSSLPLILAKKAPTFKKKMEHNNRSVN